MTVEIISWNCSEVALPNLRIGLASERSKQTRPGVKQRLKLQLDLALLNLPKYDDDHTWCVARSVILIQGSCIYQVVKGTMISE